MQPEDPPLTVSESLRTKSRPPAGMPLAVSPTSFCRFSCLLRVSPHQFKSSLPPHAPAGRDAYRQALLPPASG